MLPPAAWEIHLVKLNGFFKIVNFVLFQLCNDDAEAAKSVGGI